MLVTGTCGEHGPEVTRKVIEDGTKLRVDRHPALTLALRRITRPATLHHEEAATVIGKDQIGPTQLLNLSKPKTGVGHNCKDRSFVRVGLVQQRGDLFRRKT